MKIEEDTKRQVIGELITREKYKFIPNGLIREVVRESFDELEKLEE
jgi:hypothetical protein